MLILAILCLGILAGAIAQWVLGMTRSQGGAMETMRGGVNWPMALGTGLIGSLVGGLLASLLSGNGLELRASGIIGSIIGAIIVTGAWQWWHSRKVA